MFGRISLLDLEKRAVFFVNFLLILMVVLFFGYGLPLKYFFYFDVFLTFVLSYLFFKRSKILSRLLIVTNMFILFYFLYPSIASFLYEILGSRSYLFVLFYNIFLAFLFLVFSGHYDDFLGDIKNFKFSFVFVVLVLGLCFGFFFYLVREPVPQLFVDVAGRGILEMFGFLIFSSFVVGLSEQMIFSGFLFNTYRKLSSKFDAFYQTAIFFVMFHLLRFQVLVKHYFEYFNEVYVFYIVFYYVLLFLFMLFALYLYSFRGKKYSGNFLYPVLLHFGADFGLFLFYVFGG